MATIQEIASASGVSATTVSRILNRDKTLKVTNETREKVLEAAKALHYRTVYERHSSRNYRLASVYLPDIFYDNVNGDFHYAIRNGIDQTCVQTGVNLMNVFNLSCPPLTQVDGVLIQGNYTDAEIRNMVQPFHTEHILIIGRCPDDSLYDSVWFDTKRAVYEALDYLTGLGHREIGFIGGRECEDIEPSERRDQLFIQYMSRFPEFNPGHVYIGRHGIENGYGLMEKAYGDGKLPTAFFIANDPTAIGALNYLKSRKIRVPQDVSIVGLDGHQMTQYTTPALTTVEVPTEYMGRVAVETLIEKIETSRKLTKKVYVPTKLCVRDSCVAVEKA